MFNKNSNNQNKISKTIYDHKYGLAIRCKTIVNTGLITNYIINIEDSNGGLTVLLDKDGNSLLSQIIL